MTVQELPTAAVVTNGRVASPPAGGGPRTNVGATVLTVLKYALAILSVLVVLAPMYLLVVTSFKPPAEVAIANMWFLPQEWTGAPWERAWTALYPSLGRTLILAAASSILVSLLGALNGYVLSLIRFRGANIIFGAILFGMYIPYQAVMVPLRDVVSTMGLPPGIATLIFVHTVYGIPIGTLIFRNYYINSVPKSLVEAASVDGAGVFRTFTRVILPVSAPGFVVVIIWQFTMVWNDFLFAIFLSNTRDGPVMLALSALAGAQSPDYAQSMAAAIIASAAPLLVYILLGKFFIGGLMAGSVKG
ncbi:carbohydrate ABC transporter permease [Microbacterium sp. K24]|uniref:carbohydrate ABC transporter permease n=1 Tax=Microbacterium sp. K24 TaxID=2305446 RepID=UPI00109C91FF|nr:carbohydrate ABC transporter permease [Microbacterium sp. K24]